MSGLQLFLASGKKLTFLQINRSKTFEAAFLGGGGDLQTNRFTKKITDTGNSQVHVCNIS
jgi:hypothetical protein